MRRLAAGLAIAAGLAGLMPASATADSPAPAAAPTRPAAGTALNIDNSQHLYTLDGWGGLHSAVGSPKLNSPDYFGWDIARGLAIFPDAQGGYMLDGFGALHAFGSAPVLHVREYFGWDIARSVALAPWATEANPGGWVLDGWGGIHGFGTEKNLPSPGYWGGWDIAHALVITPDSTPGAVSGYLLDGFAGMHRIGGAIKPSGLPYFGFDIARGVALVPSATSANPAGYMLDGWGGIHEFGGAVPAKASAYWAGWDIAHTILTWSGSTIANAGGWTLDGYGGLHSFGIAPAVDPNGYYGWDIARAVGGPGSTGAWSKQPPPPPPPTPWPTYLSLPRISVAGSVVPVGWDASYHMATPTQPTNIGWERYAVAPGDPGNAVFAGHLDWYTTGPAVFWNLNQAQVGDDVYIARADGSGVHYVVDSLQSYTFDAYPPDLFSRSGPSQISLITCIGSWDGTQYRNRLVVHAVKV